MKRALTILSLLFALAALPVFAGPNNLETTIPFDFAVKDQVFAAGEYEVYRMIPGTWAVRTGAGKHLALFNVVQQDYLDKSQAKLVFHRYGKQYFLAQIWSHSQAVSIPASRQELQIRASVGRPVLVALLLKR